MTPEQKLEEDNHKKADEIKAQGNEEFKKKNFDEAIKLPYSLFNYPPLFIKFFQKIEGVWGGN